MSTFEYEREKVYIDKDIMDQAGLSLEQVEQMISEEPGKYVLSMHVKRLLARKYQRT